MAFAVSQAAIRSMGAPRAIQKIAAIGLNTFRESIRQPVYGIIMAIALGLILLSPYYTMFTLMQSPKMIKDMGLATILLAGLLLAAFSAGNVIAEEIENRTVMTLLSKPVSRTEFILGKYLGVALSLLLAGYVLSVALLLTVAGGGFEADRAQTMYMHIILITAGAGLLAVILALFANYFMDRAFAPTAVVLAVPLFTICMIIFVIWTPPAVIAKYRGIIDPQVALGCVLALGALLVLGAVAVAASVRFGMVINVVLCAVVLVAGMLSDYFLGRHAYKMQVTDLYAAEGVPRTEVLQRIAWGMERQDVGCALAVKEYARALGVDISAAALAAAPDVAGGTTTRWGAYGYVATPEALAAGGVTLAPLGDAVETLRAAHKKVLCVSRQDRAVGAIAFVDGGSLPARVAYSIVPNLQVFWIADALAAERPVDPSYALRAGAYALLYIMAMLFLAMYLFESREVA